MSSNIQQQGLPSRIYHIIRESLQGEEADYTVGSLRRAVVLLAIPMMLEMILESVFAVVDLYFVGQLENSSHAIQVVGLTESVMTVLYSIAIGMSMAATAVVARRIGEKNPEGAASAGMQAIFLAVAVTAVLSITGVVFAEKMLLLMGASAQTAQEGVAFVRIMMGGSIIVMLLFLINGIFRGAGSAAIAMKSLWLANGCNIILCPLLIHGIGGFEGFGLKGAAMATTIGRGIGVSYQLYHLFNGSHAIRLGIRHIKAEWEIIKSLISISTPAILQFIIASCSWIFLASLVAKSGGDTASAAYQTSLRLLMFFILPAWGLSNAAATLVGQNLGAGQPERAEQAVKLTMKYNITFMAAVTLFSFLAGPWLIGFFTHDDAVRTIGTQALRIISAGYIFYGIGMVLINSFNGAGDTLTPTIVNFVGFWLFQVPVAWFMSTYLGWGALGVFIAVPLAESAISIASYILFRRGKWKEIKV